MDILNTLASSAIGVVEQNKKASWPEQRSLNFGDRNVINDPFVDRNNTLLPPSHIKLGIMKQFVTALDRHCFKYIFAAFPGLSEEKRKRGIFDGPQIRKLESIQRCFQGFPRK